MSVSLVNVFRYKKKEIYLYINSPGGSVTAGFGILDTMNYIKSDIEYSDYLENSWASLSRFLSRGVSASIYNNKFQERVVKLSENGSLDFANYNKIIKPLKITKQPKPKEPKKTVD